MLKSVETAKISLNFETKNSEYDSQINFRKKLLNFIKLAEVTKELQNKIYQGAALPPLSPRSFSFTDVFTLEEMMFVTL